MIILEVSFKLFDSFFCILTSLDIRFHHIFVFDFSICYDTQMVLIKYCIYKSASLKAIFYKFLLIWSLLFIVPISEFIFLDFEFPDVFGNSCNETKQKSKSMTKRIYTFTSNNLKFHLIE